MQPAVPDIPKGAHHEATALRLHAPMRDKIE